jgi:predicted phosphodiesterase
MSGKLLSVFITLGSMACVAAGQSGPALHESFEEYAPDSTLAPQGGWQHGRPGREDEATAQVVRTADAVDGDQAVAIFQDGPANRVFSILRPVPAMRGIVWVDAHIKPSQSRVVQPALDVRDGRTDVTHVGFAADGKNVVFSSYSRSYWRVFRDFPSDAARWYRLTQRIDLNARTWALWVDGKLHSCDLPILENSRQVTGIRITACGTQNDPSLIDGLYIGSTQPAGIEALSPFPLPEPEHLFRFGLFGDPQIGFGDAQPPHTRDVIRVKAAIRQAEEAGCDLVLCCGDLVHHVTDAATAGLLEAVGTFEQASWYPVSGNHDPDDWYKKHVRTELDYCFEHKGITFIGMKTWGEKHQGKVTPSQLAWLATKLEGARQKDQEIVLWCHVTPYGPNPKGWWVRDGQQDLLQLCRQYRVLAVLSGHFHRELWHFERDGTHHIVAPGMTLTRGELGWVMYDVYRDRVVQHFKPLWNKCDTAGMPDGHLVNGPLTLLRRAPAPSARRR